MRLSEIVARNNTVIAGLNKFIGMQYSEKTKSLIIQHIDFELSKTIDSFQAQYLNDFIKYDIVDSYGSYGINPHNLFTALIFNGLYFPEAIYYNDTFEIDWGTFSLHNGKLYFEERPLDEVRELRLNKILNF